MTLDSYDKPLPTNKIILIVPIASTFSTSLKIEEVLKKDHQCNNILSPHINLLLVCNEKLSDGEVREEINEIEYKYGWNHINTKDRIISVKPFYENIKKSDPNKKVNTKEEKYFLALPTEWQDINNCKLCFPSANPLEEKALNITDKTSVTPSLVFDLPKGRVISGIDLIRPFILEPDMLEYGHFTRDENDYHYYFYIEKFFVKNKDQVKKWLDKEVRSKLNYKDSDNVLIIAPGHYSNTAFVNFVNETLFSNSANILHYDSKKDHIQNFQLFYQNEVMRADKIYYVDDTITSGGTFTRANYYIKQTREKDEFEVQPGFDAAIVLLDRSSFFVNKNIVMKLLYNHEDKNKIGKQNSKSNKDDNANKLFAFTNLHLPSLKISHDECPLCKEKERYDQLVKVSFLDRLQVHFMKQSQKIMKRDITSSAPPNNVGEYHEEKSRYLKRVAAIHVLFEWFSKPEIPFEQITTFGKFIASINDIIPKILPTGYLNIKAKDSIINDNATILKVLIQPPFTNYQPIKAMVFKWVLLLLEHQIKIIENEIRDGNLQYESFRDFKFLLRRAGLLNSNFLIHNSLFDLLKQLYDNNNLYSLYEKDVTCESKNQTLSFEQTDLFKKYSNEEKKQNVLDFNIFYAAHVKELLFLNEARSIQLEEMLIEYGMKKDNSHSFNQLLRILREENSILIRQVWEVVNKKHKWEINDIHNDLSNKNILTLIENSSIQDYYRFSTLAEYFEKCGTPLNEDNTFLDYLALMKFFSMDKEESVNNHQSKTEYEETVSDKVILNDNEETINNQPTKKAYEETDSIQVKKDSDNSKKKSITLTEKTNFIMHRLKIIMFGQNNKDVGAFFIVKYKSQDKDSLFLAYNYGSLRSAIETQHENIKYISAFITGIPEITKQSKITIIELEKKLDKWYNLYSSLEEEIVENLNPYFDFENFNRLFLIRINKREFDDKNTIVDIPQGVIGFYYSGNDKIIDVNRTKYLLLLRSEISEFTNRHHENNEFWEWREENIKKSLNLLTGHGREMLLSIARKHSEFHPIILSMLLVQRFVLDFNDEKRMKNGKEPDIIPRSFYQYYFDREYEKDHIPLHQEIGRMAKHIYQLEDIENSDDEIDISTKNEILENPDTYLNDSADKIFSQSLIKLFCFEIIVNAKKNRWHFDVIAVNGINKNKLGINISQLDDFIIISISSTGPDVPFNIIKDLNNPDIINIKGDGNDAAGIALIKTIIQTFRLGSVGFKCTPIDKEMGLSNFIVTLKLSEKELKKYVEEINPYE